MNRAFWSRTIWDALPLLACCSALIMGFIWLRLWIISQIDFAEATNLFAKILPKFIERMLPVPLEMIATIEGRLTFGHEELPVLLLMSLWTVARGTECLAGRLGDGTMELLLAQPIRRLTVVASHSAITLAGTAIVASAAWLGIAVGIFVVGFEEPTTMSTYLPATLNLLCLGIFLVGASTLVSAVARSRNHALGIMILFIVVELACKIMGRLSPQVAWLRRVSFMSAYEPTLLTTGMHHDSSTYGPLLWQYNATLAGLGLAALILAAAIFCRRDLPAPL